MKLLTQNSDLRKTGIYGWTLPAHYVTLSNGNKFNTCPSAGVCAGFCYAKTGTYMFSNVKQAHVSKLELLLRDRDNWQRLMVNELKHKRYINKYVRIHDAGDFFDKDYAERWVSIARDIPNTTFYTYTKEVRLFKFDIIGIPDNFIVIFSYGGNQDYLIDRDNDRHSDVFIDYEQMIKEGYNDIGDDDKQSAINSNKKVGLYRNNIPHYIKKMKLDKFSSYAKGKP